MPSNDNKEWVSSTCEKKNGDNYEQEDECILNDDHGVTNLTRSIAREDDYRYEEN